MAIPPITTGGYFFIDKDEKIRCEEVRNRSMSFPDPRVNCEVDKKGSFLGVDIATSLDSKGPIRPVELFKVKKVVLEKPQEFENTMVVARMEFKPDLPLSCVVVRSDEGDPPVVKCKPTSA